MLDIQKDKCCGCGACFQVCPAKCIEMISDFDGFKYPMIDKKKCIDCGRCNSICPTNNVPLEQIHLGYYCAKAKSCKYFGVSSSGAVFAELSEYVLKQKGVVFGAAFNERFELGHVSITSIDALPNLLGSKYLQSDTRNTYNEVKEYLKKGSLVMYCGTPCQIHGLKRFLGTRMASLDRLILVDFVCHGVPSPKLWKKYLQYREGMANSKLQKVNFREKKNGWAEYAMFMQFENGTQYLVDRDKDMYLSLFINGYTLRDSCYKCEFKIDKHASDLTIADFWQVKKVFPDLDSKDGISLVFINTEKGRSIFESIKKELSVVEITREKALLDNKSAKYNPIKSPKRNKIYKNIDKNCDFEKIYKMGRLSLFRRAIRYMKKCKAVLKINIMRNN